MGGYAHRRWARTALTPRLLVGGGLVASVAFAYVFLTNTPFVREYLPERLIEFLLLGIPAFGLTYAGYWLDTLPVAPERTRRIGSYALGGVLVAAASTAVVLVLFPLGVPPGPATFFLFVSTGTEGALVGVLVGVLAVTDLFARSSAELSVRSEQFEHVERVADIGYWELDPTVEPYEIRQSEGGYELYGLSPDEPLAVDDVLDRLHPEDRPRVEAAVERAVEAGEPFDLEARLDGTDGRWVHLTGDPLTRRGEVVAVRGTVQDVSERKDHERELERRNDRLDEFAGVVSHDLRNPLNVAAGRVELARAACECGNADEHLAATARAHDRMGTLIDDLLTLAREGETADPQPVALDAVVERCWGHVDTGGAALVCEAEGSVRADPGRLQQLLENLFRNAVEHGSTGNRPEAGDGVEPRGAGGAVERGDAVNVTVGSLEDGARFYVADDGPGVPEDVSDRLFEPGYSTSDDGTGFGLSIVEAIADAHGWEVDVTRSADGGARFEITGVERA
ncbi:MAG: sensor histidine kinase [Haloferacaceae archaeon]